MRTVHQMRTDRRQSYSAPLFRAVAPLATVEAKLCALTEIASPALMGGLWALADYSPAAVERARNALFRAEPLLADFVATALQDAQYTENDEACTDEREPRDTGTIYTLEAETFDKLAEIVSRFRADCGEHIAAALELTAGDEGLVYARQDISEERIGSCLWLAVTGSGVTFTDDGDAPCLVAMADWARSQWVESLYFGDNGALYLA